MADSDGVVFTGSAADRIADAVRWVERHRGRNTQSGEGEAPSPPVVYARLTSGDADGSGHYPAVITLYSAADAAWNDYSAVKVKAPNGETLANGTRYAVRPVGRTTGGDELYATLGGGEPAASVPVWLVTNVCPVFDDEGEGSPGRYIRTGDGAGGDLAGYYPNPTIPKVDGGTF